MGVGQAALGSALTFWLVFQFQGRRLPDWQFGERSVSRLYYRDRRMTPRLRSFITFSLKEFARQ